MYNILCNNCNTVSCVYFWHVTYMLLPVFCRLIKLYWNGICLPVHSCLTILFKGQNLSNKSLHWSNAVRSGVLWCNVYIHMHTYIMYCKVMPIKILQNISIKFALYFISLRVQVQVAGAMMNWIYTALINLVFLSDQVKHSSSHKKAKNHHEIQWTLFFSVNIFDWYMSVKLRTNLGKEKERIRTTHSVRNKKTTFLCMEASTSWHSLWSCKDFRLCFHLPSWID